MDEFYVYVYLDPLKEGKFDYEDLSFEYEPFYIGKGKNGRINKYNRKTSNIWLREKLEYLQKIGITPISLKIFQSLSEQDAYRIERDVIKKIGRKDKKTGPLLNLTNGGQGFKGCNSYRGGFTGKHSTETKKRLSRINKGKSYIEKVGDKKAAEWVEKSRTSNIGKHKQSSENIERIKNLWLGKKIPNDIRKKMSKGRMGIKPYNAGKIIYQYTLEMDFISEIFLYEIPKKFNIPCSNVIKCCKGERKSAGGFIWKYNKN